MSWVCVAQHSKFPENASKCYEFAMMENLVVNQSATFLDLWPLRSTGRLSANELLIWAAMQLLIRSSML